MVFVGHDDAPCVDDSPKTAGTYLGRVTEAEDPAHRLHEANFDQMLADQPRDVERHNATIYSTEFSGGSRNQNKCSQDSHPAPRGSEAQASTSRDLYQIASFDGLQRGV